MKSKLISAQEITKKYHIAYQTLNYYTNLGLLEVVAKKSKSRLYDELHTKNRLVHISQLVNEGYPLRLIRKKLNGA